MCSLAIGQGNTLGVLWVPLLIEKHAEYINQVQQASVVCIDIWQSVCHTPSLEM